MCYFDEAKNETHSDDVIKKYKNRENIFAKKLKNVFYYFTSDKRKIAPL